MQTLPLYIRRSRDWFLVLLCAGLLALALSGLNWFLFVRVPSPVEQDAVGESMSSFSRERLDTVLADYEARTLHYESVLRTFPPVADPARER